MKTLLIISLLVNAFYIISLLRGYFRSKPKYVYDMMKLEKGMQIIVTIGGREKIAKVTGNNKNLQTISLAFKNHEDRHFDGTFSHNNKVFEDRNEIYHHRVLRTD